eukprot:4237590-Alexandrium_andersonii.AAC.1
MAPAKGRQVQLAGPRTALMPCWRQETRAAMLRLQRPISLVTAVALASQVHAAHLSLIHI